MSNVLSISAIELVEKLKSGEISCVDACKEYLKRVDKFDKDVKEIKEKIVHAESSGNDLELNELLKKYDQIKKGGLNGY